MYVRQALNMMKFIYLPQPEMCSPQRYARCQTDRASRNGCESRGTGNDMKAAHPLNSPEFDC